MIFGITFDALFLLEATHKLDKENFNEISLQTIPKMKESIIYLKDIINDIYNFYSNPTNKEIFNFKTEIDSLLRILSEDIKSNNIIIFQEINDAQEYYSYRCSFLNILMIILENSIYQLKNFIKEDRYIKISLKNEDKCIKIMVQDNGGGVGLVLAKKLTQDRLNQDRCQKYKQWHHNHNIFTFVIKLTLLTL